MADCPCVKPSPRPTGLDAATRLRDFALALRPDRLVLYQSVAYGTIGMKNG